MWIGKRKLIIGDLIMENSFYRDGTFWRKKSADGSDGKGDLIFNTCYKIIQDVDVSPWALSALGSCGLLLKMRKRWPNRMDDGMDAESWIERIIVRSLKKIGIVVKRYEFRYQGRMTRDGYIAWITACTLTHNEYMIKGVTLPWYLYSRNTWRWRRRLIQDDRMDYVQRLGYLRSLAVVFKFETV